MATSELIKKSGQLLLLLEKWHALGYVHISKSLYHSHKRLLKQTA